MSGGGEIGAAEEGGADDYEGVAGVGYFGGFEGEGFDGCYYFEGEEGAAGGGCQLVWW